MAKPDPIESRKETVKLIATVVAAVAAFVGFSDWVQYGNMNTCPTTHLRALVRAMKQYRLDHEERLPACGHEKEDLGVYLVDRGVFNCERGPEYVWPNRPPNVSKGEYLLVRCPAGVHGLLRTYAWGIRISNGELQIVRVKNSGRCEPVKRGRPE